MVVGIEGMDEQRTIDRIRVPVVRPQTLTCRAGHMLRSACSSCSNPCQTEVWGCPSGIPRCRKRYSVWLLARQSKPAFGAEHRGAQRNVTFENYEQGGPPGSAAWTLKPLP